MVCRAGHDEHLVVWGILFVRLQVDETRDEAFVYEVLPILAANDITRVCHMKHSHKMRYDDSVTGGKRVR